MHPNNFKPTPATAPPRVYAMYLIDNGKREILTPQEFEEFEHLFRLCNKNNIAIRLLELEKEVQFDKKSIIAIYGNIDNVIVNEYPNVQLNFHPPVLV